MSEQPKTPGAPEPSAESPALRPDTTTGSATPEAPASGFAPGADPAPARAQAPATAEEVGSPESQEAREPGEEAVSPAAGSGADARRPRRGRVTIEFAECTLGEILNVSPTGLRARYKGPRANLPKLEDRFDMQVQTPDGPAAVRARVAWIRRVGFRKYDIGVHFVPTDEKNAGKLRQLAGMAGRANAITDGTGGARLRAGDRIAPASQRRPGTDSHRRAG